MFLNYLKQKKDSIFGIQIVLLKRICRKEGINYFQKVRVLFGTRGNSWTQILDLFGYLPKNM